MTILYINNARCNSLEQLRGFFTNLSYGDCAFADLLDNGRHGIIASWLRDRGQGKLADAVDGIDASLRDAEYVTALSKSIRGVGVAIEKPKFTTCFELQNVDAEQVGNGAKVKVRLKVLQSLNETYELKVSTHWGTRAFDITSIDEEEGDTLTEVFDFQKRPGVKMTEVTVFGDGEVLTKMETQNASTMEEDKDGLTFTVRGVTFKMMRVERGTFTMGASSTANEPCSNDKSHEVTLTKDYCMGQTQVTQALWKAVMGNNPSHFKGDNLPVERVSWNDCREFLRNLNSMTGRKFRLPTEAEWEFAASGGNKSAHTQYSGGNDIDEVAWYYKNSGEKTHPVATKRANELDIYDMIGNVYEWCQDWYGDYERTPQTDPTGPSTGDKRVIRGGSFGTNAELSRFSDRLNRKSEDSFCNLGFRLCLDAENVDAEEQSTSSQPATASVPTQSTSSQPATASVPTPKPSMDFTVGGVSFKMMRVEGGTFTMGDQESPFDDENITHKVTLAKDYYMGQTVVTQALWKVVMGRNPSRFKGDNLPVESVSWNDCQKFLTKLNGLTGRKFRLPTEAEWEFAARGGNRSKHTRYSGSGDMDEVAWYDENSGGTPHPVATKRANELGIYDMSGNVWEWCQDRYGNNHSNPQTNPTGPDRGSNRVNRGGSWHDSSVGCAVGFRYFRRSNDHGNGLGFRLCLDAENGETETLPIQKQTTTTSMPFWLWLLIVGVVVFIVRNASDHITSLQVASENTASEEMIPAEVKEVIPPADDTACTLKDYDLQTQSFTVEGVDFVMVKVEGGTFTMGATPERVNPDDDEQLAHEVMLTNDYYLGQTEVTQALWKVVMGSNPSHFKGDNLPVECVSWDDCQEFLTKLNRLTDRKFRLPTEAEWEFAARGGNRSNHTQYSGGSDLDDVAWYHKNSGEKTHPVATKRANELGIYDMSGNVWEWCMDWYGKYSGNLQTNPIGADSGSDRVVRGGSWCDGTGRIRSSYRSSLTLGIRISGLGFRLCLSE